MSTLDTLAGQIPQELRVKLMQHFGIAKEYEKTPETISITYYCMMYVANEALKLQKEKQFVSNVLDYLEATKKNNPQDDIIKSLATGQQTIEELISMLVLETNEMDNEDEKSADQLRLLMRKHYTVGGLTDVLSVFGPVKDDFVTLGKIAKSRAVAIFRDLKAGAGSNASGASAAPPRPHENNAPAMPPARPASSAMPQPQAPSSHASSVYPDHSSGRATAPFDVISQAQKLCRYANSALEHEDIGTAVKNCEEVLRLLRPYNN